MHAADKATGFATAATGISGIGWVTNSAFLSALGFVATALMTLWAWWMVRVEKKQDHDRRQRMADAVANIEVGQAAALDEMLSRMRHLEKVVLSVKDKA